MDNFLRFLFRIQLLWFALVSCESFNRQPRREIEKYIGMSKAAKPFFEGFVKMQEEKMNYIKRCRNSLHKNKKLVEDPSQIVSNAIAGFKLMKRLTFDWPLLLEIVQFDQFEEIKKYEPLITSSMSKLGTVFKETLEDFISDQEELGLLSKVIAKGHWPKKTSAVTLRSDECYLLGMHCMEEDDRIYLAEEWFIEAKNRYKQEKSITNPLKEVYLNLAFIAFKTGRFEEVFSIRDEWNRVKGPHVQYDDSRIHQLAGLTKAEIASIEKTGHRRLEASRMKSINDLPSLTSYKSVCSGEWTMPEADKAKLKCRYSNRGSPLFILSPVKEEDVYLEPRIVLYHQFALNREMDLLVSRAVGKMDLELTAVDLKARKWSMRASRVFLMKGENVKSLSPDQKELLSIYEHRMSALTKMSRSGIDAIEVGYYEAGNFFQPHLDGNYAKLHSPKGRRITTTLTYVNEVEEGGATGFTFLNFAVQPERGSVLVWFNVDHHNHADHRTRHTGCPVIYGHKWMINIWYFEIGQEFSKPCTNKPEMF